MEDEEWPDEAKMNEVLDRVCSADPTSVGLCTPLLEHQKDAVRYIIRRVVEEKLVRTSSFFLFFGVSTLLFTIYCVIRIRAINTVFFLTEFACVAGNAFVRCNGLR